MTKITQEDLQALIDKEEYARFGETCTVCALTLKSGYTVAVLTPNNLMKTLGVKLPLIMLLTSCGHCTAITSKTRFCKENNNGK